MSIEITLSTWERVHLAVAVGSQPRPGEGTVARIRALISVLNVLELDDAEKLMTGWRQEMPGMAIWENLDWKLVFTDQQFQDLCGVAIPFDRWPVHRCVEPMVTKLTQCMLLAKADQKGQ